MWAVIRNECQRDCAGGQSVISVYLLKSSVASQASVFLFVSVVVQYAALRAESCSIFANYFLSSLQSIRASGHNGSSQECVVLRSTDTLLTHCGGPGVLTVDLGSDRILINSANVAELLSGARDAKLENNTADTDVKYLNQTRLQTTQRRCRWKCQGGGAQRESGMFERLFGLEHKERA